MKTKEELQQRIIELEKELEKTQQELINFDSDINFILHMKKLKRKSSTVTTKLQERNVAMVAMEMMNTNNFTL